MCGIVGVLNLTDESTGKDRLRLADHAGARHKANFLMGVLTTQTWAHMFLESTLAVTVAVLCVALSLPVPAGAISFATQGFLPMTTRYEHAFVQARDSSDFLPAERVLQKVDVEYAYPHWSRNGDRILFRLPATVGRAGLLREAPSCTPQ